MQPKSPPNPGRRKFLIAATSAVGAVGVAGAAIPFLGSWNPSARAEAAGAPAIADISKLQPGELLIVEWRGVPIYVVKHSEKSLNQIDKNLERLADPESVEEQQPEYARNKLRSRRKGISVLTAVCTHLACAPKYYPQLGVNEFDNNWQGGFFCPCHGSKFDLAGRVYAGVPAPTNLPVPPHYYKSEDILVIGEDGDVA
ncbi:MAG: ubiquinol-cytochrome c reductase iron-sulfur subunit [Candidatus Marinimicrobia bacterium]|nr:ubiquinol-cytochrome c reductase iron-sulfur subunit [Candidatus Neomarinimicrobiota bacterium]|tara:strand:- start:80 stop:676 length:597 start_codon:yes stop_codon:yes gene_type:complete